MVKLLTELLEQIQYQSGEKFAGIGLIVCTEVSDLPIFKLRLDSGAEIYGETIENLVRISSIESKYHDGFHVISPEGQVMSISQYFSPPICDNLTVDYTRSFGGRYVAALFGSMLSGVVITGIASKGFGIAIFSNGQEVYYKKND